MGEKIVTSAIFLVATNYSTLILCAYLKDGEMTKKKYMHISVRCYTLPDRTVG